MIIPLKLQIILFFSSCGVLFVLLYLVKKHKLELKNALLWIFLNIIAIIISIFPQLSKTIAEIIGIITPVNVLFLLGIVSLFLISFSLTISLSKATGTIKDTVQELGILKQELEEIKSAKENKKPTDC